MLFRPKSKKPTIFQGLYIGAIAQQIGRALFLIRPFSLFFGGFLDRHVMKFFGIKHIAAFKALNKLGVFMAGNNSNPGVFAGADHRFGGRIGFGL